MHNFATVNTLLLHEPTTKMLPAKSATDIVLKLSELPNKDNFVFEDSSFFTNNATATLPTPAEVRARARAAEESNRGPSYRPRPVKFESMNLLVKYGSAISIAEGQCLWAVRKHLQYEVPVPEIYGWCTDNREVFLYMELVQGDTLEERWGSMSAKEKDHLCLELSSMLLALRRLKQVWNESFVGDIACQPLKDVIFEYSSAPPAGPFASVKAFHDFFTYPDYLLVGYDPSTHFMRCELPDDSLIRFTHGDLHPSNIIVSPSSSPIRILALIDWHQSGWLPEYWEYCKSRWTAKPDSEWTTRCLPLIFPDSVKTKSDEKTSADHYLPFEWFALSLGL